MLTSDLPPYREATAKIGHAIEFYRRDNDEIGEVCIIASVDTCVKRLIQLVCNYHEGRLLAAAGAKRHAEATVLCCSSKRQRSYRNLPKPHVFTGSGSLHVVCWCHISRTPTGLH